MRVLLFLLFLSFTLFFTQVKSQCSVAHDDETKLHFTTGWGLTTSPENFGDRTKIEFQGLRLWIAPGTGELQVVEIATNTVVWAWGNDRDCSTTNLCYITFAFDGNLKMYYQYISSNDKMLSNTYGNVGRMIRLSTSPPYFVVLDAACAVAWPKNSAALGVTILPRTTPVAGKVLPTVTASIKALPANKWRSSFGMNTHIAQGWPSDQTYNMATYLGVGLIRDRAPPSSKYPDFLRMKNAGIKAMFSVVKPADLSVLTAQVQAMEDFETAVPGMITIVEGFNELDNFGFVYEGVDYRQTYAGMFKAQRDFYSLVKNSAKLKNFPVADFTGGCTHTGLKNAQKRAFVTATRRKGLQQGSHGA